MPLVADAAQAVDIGQSVAGGESLTLGRRAADADYSGGCVVDVGDRDSGRAGLSFERAVTVGVARAHAHLLSDLSFGQSAAARRGAGNGDPRRAIARRLPVVADAADAIRVGQSIDRDQRLVLARRTRYCNCARRGVVDVGNRCRRRAGDGFSRAVAVGVARADAHLVADLGFAQCEAVGSGAGDIAPRNAVGRGLPLVADAALAVNVGQGVAGDQRLALDRRAADADYSGRGIIDVGDGCGCSTGHRLDRAMAVGVAGGDADGLADLRFGQRETAGGGTADGDAVGLPLVTDAAEAIDVGEGVRGRQRLVLGGGTADAHGAGRQVIDVGDGCGCSTGHRLRRAMPVGVPGADADGFADLRFGQDQGTGGGAADGYAVGLPLVADRAQTVYVAQGVAGGEGLVLGRRAADADCSGRGVIDVGNGDRRGTRHGFGGAVAVGVTGNGTHLLPDLRFAQRKAAGGGAGNGVPRRTVGRALPLVTDGAQTIDVRQGVAGAQRLVLRGGAAQRHGTGRRIVDVGNGRRGRAGLALQRTVTVGVAGDGTDLLPDLRFAQGEAARGGATDAAPGRTVACALPLVADGAQAVDVGQGVAGGQRLTLGRRAGYADCSRWCVIDIGDGCGCSTGHRLRRAMAVGVAGGDADGLADLRFGQHQGTGRCTADGNAVGLPLVRDYARAIDVGERVGGGEGLPLRRRAGYADCSRRCVIDVGNRCGCSTGHRLRRAVPVGVAGGHADGLADLRFGQHQGTRRCAADGDAVGLPLVADRAQTVYVAQGVAGGEGLVLGRRAADADCSGRGVIDVGNGDRRGTRHGFGGAVAVGVTGNGTHLLPDLRFAQRKAAGGGTGDIAPRRAVDRALPLVANTTQAIGVGQGVRGGERLILRGAAAQRHGARRCVVDIGNSASSATGLAFQRAVAVGVTRHGAHLLADLRFRQREAARSGAGNIAPRRAIGRGLPLVADTTDAIRVGQGIARGQGLALGCRPADADCSGRRVIDVGDRHRRRARDGFDRTMTVGVASNGPHLHSNLRFAQRETARRGAADRGPRAAVRGRLPLVANSPHTIHVDQTTHHRQRLVLRRRPAETQGPRRGRIHPLPNVRRLPDRAIREDHAFHRILPRRRLVEAHAVGGRNGKLHLRTRAAGRHAGRQDARTEDQLIDAAGVDEAVGPAADGERVDVVAGAAFQHIGIPVAGERIVQTVARAVDRAAARQRQILGVAAQRVADRRKHRIAAFAR